MSPTLLRNYGFGGDSVSMFELTPNLFSNCCKKRWSGGTSANHPPSLLHTGLSLVLPVLPLPFAGAPMTPTARTDDNTTTALN